MQFLLCKVYNHISHLTLHNNATPARTSLTLCNKETYMNQNPLSSAKTSIANPTDPPNHNIAQDPHPSLVRQIKTDGWLVQ